MSPLLDHSNPFDTALQSCQSKRRRNGKVARLPAVLREQINQMIDDGIPYKTIIEKLGDSGKHLGEDSLSSWRRGGYQDYLKAQALNERALTQIEAAADVIRETGDLDPAHAQRACQQFALLQYMDVLLEHGDEIAKNSLKENPAKMITLINSICNMTNSSLAIEKRNARIAADIPAAPPAYPESTIQNPVSSFPNPSEPNRTLKK